MALTPKLELRQGQSLVMTPQLQQAIKLLQLSNLELLEYVDQEIERNPLLEYADPARPERGDSDLIDRDRAASEERDGDSGDGFDDAAALPDSAEHAGDTQLSDGADGPLDLDPDAGYDDEPHVPAAMEYAGAVGSGGRTDFDDDLPGFEQTLSRDISLKDHLTEQLTMELSDPVDRLIGVHLIDTVNEAGYVSADLEAIADHVGCARERVEETLARLQKFDPAGVFARTLEECLALQLRELDRLDPVMQCFLGHLDLLARHDMAGLAKACGVDPEDIADMASEIRALNPKPGLSFGSEVVQPVVPDVFVRGTAGGGWQIELNNDTLPHVLVNMFYFAEISGRAKDQREKAFLNERLHSANWLVKSLDQRANTILRVATELVRQQDAFLARGIEFLRPLNLRDIATAIEMHESTVSRVTANKYISTPRGIFPMKYFFTSAISSSSGGEAHSAASVRHRIRELIDAEPDDAVLSDDRIVEILRQSGVDIARRTVAKYRESMRIPSSVERRRRKKATR